MLCLDPLPVVLSVAFQPPFLPQVPECTTRHPHLDLSVSLLFSSPLPVKSSVFTSVL